MLKPFNHGDRAYATDGHVLISVPRQEGLAEEKTYPIAKAFPKTGPDEWFPVPAVEVQPCKYCNGKVVNYTCHECGGSGYVNLANDFHEYNIECETCEGSGEAICCPFCNMTGVNADGLVSIGNAHFKANLLHLIKDLPNIKISPTGPITAAWLSFDGGEGALMPAYMPSKQP